MKRKKNQLVSNNEDISITVHPCLRNQSSLKNHIQHNTSKIFEDPTERNEILLSQHWIPDIFFGRRSFIKKIFQYNWYLYFFPHLFDIVITVGLTVNKKIIIIYNFPSLLFSDTHTHNVHIQIVGRTKWKKKRKKKRRTRTTKQKRKFSFSLQHPPIHHQSLIDHLVDLIFYYHHK